MVSFKNVVVAAVYGITVVGALAVPVTPTNMDKRAVLDNQISENIDKKKPHPAVAPLQCPAECGCDSPFPACDITECRKCCSEMC